SRKWARPCCSAWHCCARPAAAAPGCCGCRRASSDSCSAAATVCSCSEHSLKSSSYEAKSSDVMTNYRRDGNSSTQRGSQIRIQQKKRRKNTTNGKRRHREGGSHDSRWRVKKSGKYHPRFGLSFVGLLLSLGLPTRPLLLISHTPHGPWRGSTQRHGRGVEGR
ncbi:hypothetical protein DQ04_21391000, partial [Trypanosoma grayi]|uniref:hypothetical protein n=1 Tax=Trypanosoma grayi TaxID=71804 RepID=UPI0004F4529D